MKNSIAGRSLSLTVGLLLLGFGASICADELEAIRRAAEEGDPSAQFEYGSYLARQNDDDSKMREAVKWYRKAAEQGHAGGQEALGRAYSLGQVVPESDQEALKWYRKAAKQGNAKAQEGVCVRVYDEENYKEAMEWCRKAGDQGQGHAQSIVGEMYYYGLGAPKDYQEAARWFRLASTQYPFGEEAYYYLGEIYLSGGNGAERNWQEAAKAWLKIAESEIVHYFIGEARLARVQHNLGIMYDSGDGVPRDSWEASKWYRRAAENYRVAAEYGSLEARLNLAILLQNGTGVPRDEAQALELYERAVSEDPEVVFAVGASLGSIYSKGGGVPPDYIKAHFWLNVAAASGNEKAANERDALANKMKPEQIAEAQRLAREWWAKHEEQ